MAEELAEELAVKLTEELAVELTEELAVELTGELAEELAEARLAEAPARAWVTNNVPSHRFPPPPPKLARP
jgi:hypothetical protein